MVGASALSSEAASVHRQICVLTTPLFHFSLHLFFIAFLPLLTAYIYATVG